MKPKASPETIGPKRFKLVVYYSGPDAGFASQMAYNSVSGALYSSGLDVKVEASWEELLP